MKEQNKTSKNQKVRERHAKTFELVLQTVEFQHNRVRVVSKRELLHSSNFNFCKTNHLWQTESLLDRLSFPMQQRRWMKKTTTKTSWIWRFNKRVQCEKQRESIPVKELTAKRGRIFPYSEAIFESYISFEPAESALILTVTVASFLLPWYHILNWKSS